MSFVFDYPFMAILALVLIPAAILAQARQRNPFIALIPLGAPGGTPFRTVQLSKLIKFVKVLELLGFILLFISAAGPSINKSEILWLNRGADIIFILDTSPSMAALDMNGRSRLSAARTLLLEFSRKRPTDGIGLVTVGNNAALLLPPVIDRESLELRLENIRAGEMGDGTALGTGLAVAGYHLQKSNAKRKVAVLITDGENNAGSIQPETAAAMLRDMDISLWVIGIGSTGVVPIDYVDPHTGIRQAGTFDSRFSTESLQRLSFAGNGAYIAAPSANTFAAAFSKIDDAEMIIRRSSVINRRKPVFLPFLLSAVVLLAGARFIRCYALGALI